jgi:PleD family two-component response regulator
MPPGVTTFQRGDSELSLLKRADTALDLAKQRGRNPVAADTPT